MRCFSRRRSALGLAPRFAIVLTASLATAGAACAAVSVSGTKDAMTLEAKDASLEDVIAQINSSLSVKISLSSPVGSAITGTYSGSLRRVLTRILDGHDFVLTSAGDTITVTLAAGARSGRNRPAVDGGPTAVQGWNNAVRFKAPVAGR